MQCQKDLLNVILELKKVKVEKNEIEPYVFKVSEEISNNSTLKSYYNALYGKLHSAMTGADTIASGQLASDTSDIQVTAISARLSLIPIVGKYVGSEFNGGVKLIKSNKYKIMQ